MIQGYIRLHWDDVKGKSWPFVRVDKYWDLGGGYALMFTRTIRGDLILLKLDGEDLMGWVDQSYQYDGMMGLNDISHEPIFTLEMAEFLLEMLWVPLYKRPFLKLLRLFRLW